MTVLNAKNVYGSRDRIINDHEGKLLSEFHRLRRQIFPELPQPRHAAKKIHRPLKTREHMSGQSRPSGVQKPDFDGIEVTLSVRGK